MRGEGGVNGSELLKWLHLPGAQHRPLSSSERQARKIERFKSWVQAQRFVSTHSATYNVFNLQRHLLSRTTLCTFRAAASADWNAASAAAA